MRGIRLMSLCCARQCCSAGVNPAPATHTPQYDHVNCAPEERVHEHVTSYASTRALVLNEGGPSTAYRWPAFLIRVEYKKTRTFLGRISQPRREGFSRSGRLEKGGRRPGRLEKGGRRPGRLVLWLDYQPRLPIFSKNIIIVVQNMEFGSPVTAVTTCFRSTLKSGGALKYNARTRSNAPHVPRLFPSRCTQLRENQGRTSFLQQRRYKLACCDFCDRPPLRQRERNRARCTVCTGAHG